jgi:two-component system, chemotaxis family, protein-glutamate methylesterase/glutaminase
MLRTIVAEDSATARSLLVAILSADPDIQVVGEAANGAEAVALTRRLRPDVVTMDITMPLMDGFEATREIMASVPTPIVIVTASGLAREVQTGLRALQAGALAVLPKPPGPGAAGFEEAARQLVANVKALSQVKVVRHWRNAGVRSQESGVRSQGSGVVSSSLTPDSRLLTPELVVIATSTGGPAALHRLFAALPGDFPLPILVVQHIARGFTDGLADWLGKSTALRVKVAADGEPLAPHTVYLAPEDRHLGVSRRPAVVLSSVPPVGGFRPSGTFLFASAARSRGAGTVALILTGMGSDGVEGLAEVRRAGGHIVAQDEESSIIFGMPGAAVAAGLADVVLPLDAIPAHLMELVRHEFAKRPPRAGR